MYAAAEKKEMVATGLGEYCCDDACHALRNDRADRYHPHTGRSLESDFGEPLDSFLHSRVLIVADALPLGNQTPWARPMSRK